MNSIETALLVVIPFVSGYALSMIQNELAFRREMKLKREEMQLRHDEWAALFFKGYEDES